MHKMDKLARYFPKVENSKSFSRKKLWQNKIGTFHLKHPVYDFLYNLYEEKIFLQFVQYKNPFLSWSKNIFLKENQKKRSVTLKFNFRTFV